MNDKWLKRFALIRALGWVALLAIPFAIVAAFTDDSLQKAMTVFAVAFFLPAFVYLYVVVIWHWKDRYRGKHSDLWGALILIETTGWMKLIYLFRHLLPDIRGVGRYRSDRQDVRALDPLIENLDSISQ